MVRLIAAQKFLDGEKDFFQQWGGKRYPEYAIVSHRWEDEEVDFKDMLDESHAKHIRQKKGYHKVVDACRKALEDDLDWIWIDTCCIDKSSSAELQEAINSMFDYYREATECYVYLRDLDEDCPRLTDRPRVHISEGECNSVAASGLNVVGPCRSCWLRRPSASIVGIGHLWRLGKTLSAYCLASLVWIVTCCCKSRRSRTSR